MQGLIYSAVKLTLVVGILPFAYMIDHLRSVREKSEILSTVGGGADLSVLKAIFFLGC